MNLEHLCQVSSQLWVRKLDFLGLANSLPVDVQVGKDCDSLDVVATSALKKVRIVRVLLNQVINVLSLPHQSLCLVDFKLNASVADIQLIVLESKTFSALLELLPRSVHLSGNQLNFALLLLECFADFFERGGQKVLFTLSHPLRLSQLALNVFLAVVVKWNHREGHLRFVPLEELAQPQRQAVLLGQVIVEAGEVNAAEHDVQPVVLGFECVHPVGQDRIRFLRLGCDGFVEGQVDRPGDFVVQQIVVDLQLSVVFEELVVRVFGGVLRLF